MRILLDTHSFLWWITDDPRLSDHARKVISDGENELFFSAASGWEIAIKIHIGRLKLSQDPKQYILDQLRLNGIQSLSIHIHHALHVSNLPAHHRDPFDRLLIAQAHLEGLAIITTDANIHKYKVKVIW